MHKADTEEDTEEDTKEDTKEDTVLVSSFLQPGYWCSSTFTVEKCSKCVTFIRDLKLYTLTKGC